MKTSFRSKISLGIVFIIIFTVGLSSIPLFIGTFSWIAFSVILVVLAFIAFVFITTVYVIEDEILYVKCGWFKPTSIEINAIKEISETNNIASSPAASLDRLEISYNKKDKVIISPKRKNEFIASVIKINPAIKIKLKN